MGFRFNFNNTTGWGHTYSGDSGYTNVTIVSTPYGNAVQIQADLNVRNWIYRSYDFTNVDKIRLIVSVVGNSSVSAYGKIIIGGTTLWSKKATTTSHSYKTIEIDTSSITGTKEVRFEASKNEGAGAATYLRVVYIASVHNISASSNPTGSGTISGTGTYLYNDSVSLQTTPNEYYNFLNWTESGSIISTSNPYVFTISGNRNLVANFTFKYLININYDSTLGTASYSLGQNNIVNLIAIPNTHGQFKGWFIDGNLISRDLNTSYEVNQDTTFEARFTPKYTISLDYDSELGNASFTRDSDEQNIIYLIVNSTITQFLGWYINDTLISYNQSAQYQITEDSVIEARFEPRWEINDSVVGDGSIQYTRQSTNQNIVSFSVIPDPNRHFVKYEIDGVEELNSQITLTLIQDLTIIAFFEEDDKFHITANANIPHTSVYVSNNDDYSGYVATLWARPFPNYVFEKWSDGNVENPRNIVVDNDITLVAEFSRVQETNGIYQYRCFIKDQLDMSSPPKAFMVIDTFTLQEDKLTTSNSTITVLDMPTNVNEGDVVVVYNPTGLFIYQGVIKSISELTLKTSQIQSFFKGMWIWNNKPQTYLEDELRLLFKDFCDGKLYGSTYTDNLIAQRYSSFVIQSVGSTNANLPTDIDKDGKEKYTQMDMEKFIYKMYQDYGIDFDIEINFSGTNYVRIKVPTYQSIAIGNNHYAIQNLTPLQEIEETNKLVIYWGTDVAGQHTAKQYRTTFVATKNGIVQNPTSLVGRFNVTNTKVVFSDDDLSDLVASNLPNTMFNHKVEFTLFLKNSLYEYEEFKLCMPVEVYYNGTDYYNSVLTGRKMQKASNQNVNTVSYTLGKVRTALTDILNLSKGAV